MDESKIPAPVSEPPAVPPAPPAPKAPAAAKAQRLAAALRANLQRRKAAGRGARPARPSN